MNVVTAALAQNPGDSPSLAGGHEHLERRVIAVVGIGVREDAARARAGRNAHDGDLVRIAARESWRRAELLSLGGRLGRAQVPDVSHGLELAPRDGEAPRLAHSDAVRRRVAVLLAWTRATRGGVPCRRPELSRRDGHRRRR